MSAALAFTLPPALEAAEPPEARGLARDAVRLMVARGRGPLVHARFRDLPDHLRPGDLLVINESATIPAALPARARRRDGARAAPVDAGAAGARRRATREAVASRRAPPASLRAGRGAARGGERFPTRGAARMRGGDGRARRAVPVGGRLWIAALDLPAPLLDHVAAHGRRSATPTSPRRARLRTIRRSSRGSPGAPRCRAPGGRSRRATLRDLRDAASAWRRSCSHTGVSSQERGERPYPERYTVPAPTAAAVRRRARRAGG